MDLFVDGNNVAVRSEFALSTYDSKGRRTSAIFGTLQSLRRAVREVAPLRVIVFWDHGKNEQRKALYPEYKAHREGRTPEEIDRWEHFTAQAEALKSEFLPYLPVSSCDIEGQEADDLLAGAVLSGPGEVVILSDDRDFYQLVSNRVSIYSPRGFWVTWDSFEEVTGFASPYAYAQASYLIGDKGDNIAGIKGIGKVTAKKLIACFPTAEEAVRAWIARPDDVPPRARLAFEKDEDAVGRVKLNEKVMKLGHKSVPVADYRDGLSEGKWDEEQLEVVCRKYDFESMIERGIGDWAYPFLDMAYKARRH